MTCRHAAQCTQAGHNHCLYQQSQASLSAILSTPLPASLVFFNTVTYMFTVNSGVSKPYHFPRLWNGAPLFVMNSSEGSFQLGFFSVHLLTICMIHRSTSQLIARGTCWLLAANSNASYAQLITFILSYNHFRTCGRPYASQALSRAVILGSYTLM